MIGFVLERVENIAEKEPMPIIIILCLNNIFQNLLVQVRKNLFFLQKFKSLKYASLFVEKKENVLYSHLSFFTLFTPVRRKKKKKKPSAKVNLKILGKYVDYSIHPFSPFPNDIILDRTKSKAFAENKLHIAKMTFSRFDRVENNVGKGENAGYQHFLFFPRCFPKLSS